MEKKYIRSNWILVIIFLAFLLIPFAIISEKRFLFPLFPFLAIFGTIPIMRVTEHGLSTFSFSERKKNIFLIIVIGCIILLSIVFILRYDTPNVLLEKEKMEFSRFLVTELEGKFVETGYTTNYLPHVNMEQHEGILKTMKLSIETGDPEFKEIHFGAYITHLYANSLDELISTGNDFGLKYIVIGKDDIVNYPFLESVYHNEENYPYLVKKFDSKEEGFEKFFVKVFEIDYDKFHNQ